MDNQSIVKSDVDKPKLTSNLKCKRCGSEGTIMYLPVDMVDKIGEFNLACAHCGCKYE